MSKENNIVLISSNEDFAQKIAEKIILLRKSDNVVISGYQNAIRTVQECNAVVIVLLADGCEKTINLIGEIKKFAPIVLLTDNKELVLQSYDEGITDFCDVNCEDFELVIRIVNCLKTASNRLNLTRSDRLLVQNSILDKDTGFYTYKNAEQVINNELMSRNLKQGVFMVIAPAENSKPIFATDKIAKAIKQSLRVDDIVTFGKGTRFYILLPYTDISGAVSVLEKIHFACNEFFEIKAGLCEIADKNFAQLELDGMKAVLDAMYSDNLYITADYSDETFDNWLEDEVEIQDNNYKLFKQIYKKKLEKVIIPVFYRIQKKYEEILPNVDIFQFADKEKCVFNIKNKNQNSMMKIIYPGFAKIEISFIHQGLDSPENRDFAISLSKLTVKDLTTIVEEFIEEFRSALVK